MDMNMATTMVHRQLKTDFLQSVTMIKTPFPSIMTISMCIPKSSVQFPPIVTITGTHMHTSMIMEMDMDMDMDTTTAISA